MFTRCPGCHTVHALNAALLAGAGGNYRCGKCNKVNNALEALFDEWPEAGRKPPGAGALPTLGLKIDLDEAKKARRSPDGQEAAPEESESGSRNSARLFLRIGWIFAAVVLAVFVLAGIARFQGKTLFGPASVETALVNAGLKDEPPAEPYRDLSRIHLVSRELRSHPTLAGQLRLSATIVNRAPRSQPWPDLEIILLDAAGEHLATHRFRPSDYLDETSDRLSGMTPQAYLPLVLDLDDPGVQAVGFELEFR